MKILDRIKKKKEEVMNKRKPLRRIKNKINEIKSKLKI